MYIFLRSLKPRQNGTADESRQSRELLSTSIPPRLEFSSTQTPDQTTTTKYAQQTLDIDTSISDNFVSSRQQASPENSQVGFGIHKNLLQLTY